MRLTDRDNEILREINRWRYCLGRHVKELCGFSGARATDRRLKILIEAGYLKRKMILYGTPGVYLLTYKAKMLIGANKRIDKIRLEHINHDIYVLDTACFFLKKYNIKPSDIKTEKELHTYDGFGTRMHRADFVFTKDGLTYAVEIELNEKAETRINNNIKDNYLKYDGQIWVVPKSKAKIIRILEKCKHEYSNFTIMLLEDIKNKSES